MQNLPQIIESNIGLGDYYSKIEDNIDLAIPYYKKAYDIGLKNNLEHLLVNPCDFFISNDKAKKQVGIKTKELLSVNTKAITASINKSSNQDLKIFEAKTKLREAQEKETLIKLKLDYSNNLVAMFGTMMSALLILAIFLILQNKKLTQSKKQISTQLDIIIDQSQKLNEANSKLIENNITLEKDITENAFALEHNKKMAEKLTQATKKGDINEVKAILKAELNEEYWKELNIIKNYKDQDFIAKLHENHPNLSLTEITLSCMLKNGLSSKEIASILFRQTDSIKVSRSRLRKKLNLPKTMLLSTYLNSLK